ncbi:MAG: hypothetical protein IKT16_07020, partial [Desulfovibrio sp.]|nr:hypothetical protein [Desulfovibrio sp.]
MCPFCPSVRGLDQDEASCLFTEIVPARQGRGREASPLRPGRRRGLPAGAAGDRKSPGEGAPGLAGRRPEQPGRGPAPSCQLLAEGGQAGLWWTPAQGFRRLQNTASPREDNVNGTATALGIDAGGTHTDAVVCRDGRILGRAKVATRHDNLPASIEEVLSALMADAGEAAVRQASRITLGTTLVVNAEVQGQLDEVGLVLSAGPGLSPLRFAMGSRVHVVPGGLDHRGVEV